MKNIRRRQGQGMTEYIVIVGLIAILLIGAVRKFSNQIDVTIQGTTKEVDELKGRMDQPDVDGDNEEPPPPPARRTGTTSNGLSYRTTDGGGYEVMSGGNWVPHNAAEHGAISN
jgi:Flp pilus assembly pilin Flp